ncbi:efflux RND transporter permease subunit [Bermanella marisrubri]|uniref:Cation/multidrug efflux pump protein n=1 Tax=Bermanella marisrubri TaxID=207949 RepID=Q1N4K6_9GAMM|nr:efflux RND transporter permease subunit [Bermanella marisrubri]EAT13422.1 cation/multidrug efflux pump protein [Oceanobacter sp. RED65] [Bermanella marisrubri]QIZ84172.1 efflux RND transporter permease subunit [Bermanella marisrubri]
MSISEVSLQRPVFATVLNILVVLLGLMAYDRLTVREYPNIDVPVINVETIYLGANASIMESQVTQVLEESLSGVEGIDYISSTNSFEKSQITVYFKLDRDPDGAASDVRDRVGRVRGQLPSDIEEPIVAKVEADAQPIIWLAFSSDRHSDLEVTDIADRRVKDPLQTIPGVASVQIVGQREFAMRIWLDRNKMAAYQVTAQDIEQSLSQQNLEIPAGTIESKEREFTVLAQTDLNTIEDFENIVIRNDGGYLVKLKDVARVAIGARNDNIVSRFKGESAVALGVVKQSTANPLDVSEMVNERLPDIRNALPEGMNVAVAYDSSKFISKSIDSVYTTIIEAVILVILVIFLFLRNLKATLIPLVTIPISLIGAFSLMLLFGFSVNTLTLLAMVLAVGLVVDDAIVVLENIYRYIEEGMKPLEAAFKGMKEIAFAVIAMTFTLAAVFAPVAFTPGRTGKLFTEFSLTLAGAVVVSGFIALTLSPVMASKLLRHNPNPSRFYLKGEEILDNLTNAYKRVLEKVLSFRYAVLGVFVVTLAAIGFIYQQLPEELAPVEDRGTIIGFSIAPEGASTEYVDRYARQIEGLYAGVPEQDRYFMIVGFPSSTNSISFLGLKDWDERERSAMEIADTLQGPMFAGITGTMSFPMLPPSLGQSIIARPVEFVVQTSNSYEQLNQLMQALMGKVYQSGMFTQPDTDLKLNKPQLNIEVDRQKAADLGVSISSLGQTLQTLMAGRELTRFKKDGDQYEVVLQVEDASRASPQDLSQIYVRSQSGEMIQLSNLITVTQTVAPKELNHFNKLKSATVQAGLAEGVTIDQALDFLHGAVDELKQEMNLSVQVDYKGQTREFMESGAGLMVTFLLALIFIYLVLSAQFESFKSPLIIMLSVPPALFGALFTLWIVGGTLNVYSQIGLLTLVGLITKHGILIVEFANQLQESGQDKLRAVIEASALRLRPILMTTAAMVLGAIPLALASGAGAESREQIGWVIVGGMSFGTLLTLFVVPSFYLLIASQYRKPEQD